MKKLFISLASIMLILSLSLCLFACAPKEVPDGLWENAIYLEDTAFGTGEKTVAVEVTAGEKTIVFTINTDAATLGDALVEHSLIEGEIGAYGMYVKKVNGILADYDIDGSYWGFFKGGEYMTSGVDSTEFSDGDRFELVYTK